MRGLGSVAAARLEGTGETRPGTPTPNGEANGNYKTGEHTAELREARRLVRAIHRRGPRGCPHEPRRVTAAPTRAHVNARVQAGAPPVSPRPRRAGGGSRGAR